MSILRIKYMPPNILLVAMLVAVIFTLASSPVYATAEANTYQVGDIENEVSDIQAMLNRLGYDCGIVDGVFGNKTLAAVKAFQTAKELEPTGIVDAATYRALLGREIPAVSRGASHASVRRIVQTSMSYIGVPYRFGGTTPSGFDCSGFTRFIFGQAGVNLPRMADEQFAVGASVSKRNLQAGDLVFFSTYASGASHVGIYLGDGRFISATSSSGIQVTSLNDGYYWGSRYIGARRVL